MTTPAGWYDDGSGRQRWWDGTQWTEHFAPIVESAPSAAGESAGGLTGEATTDRGSESADVSGHSSSDATPDSAAAAETAAAIESVAAVESQSWNTPAPSDSRADAETPAEPSAHQDAGAAPSYGAPVTDAPVDEAGTTHEQGSTSPESPTPTDDIVPPYANTAGPSEGGAPSYPGTAAPSYPQEYPAAPAYPGSAAPSPSYPGAAAYAPAGQQYGAPAGYPPAYGATTPVAPARPSVLGLVGLGLAALGTILSCIPVIFWLGWLLLGVGFIVSLISLFLKGRKWPGISGLILSIIGAIIAVVMFFVIVFATVSEAVRDLPSAPPSSDSDTGIDDGTTDDGTGSAQVEEGTIGDTVALTFLGGSGEITVTEARWATSDGSSVPSTNGGYVTLETTWTGVEGTTAANPLFTSLETAEGVEGQVDFFVTGAPNELLDPGQTVSGPITFDIAQSESYVFVVTDEAGRDIARIDVAPSAG
ncbi:DUF2510 domain-containing protein [Microbacterium sp. NPDC079176]|uniref:DUF2510 domain-containing protein n=1 Tax=Microbacterium sp. NPDC079176 TaxID=3154768 RepID=UPI003414789D